MNKLKKILKRVTIGGSNLEMGLKFNYVFGLGLGGLGRTTKQEWIPAIPPVMSLFYGSFHWKNILANVAYGAGVATVHSDKIYYAIRQYMPQITPQIMECVKNLQDLF